MSDLFAELKRRNVLRVGAAYLVAAWLVLQFIDVVLPMLGMPDTVGKPVLVVLAIGLPIVLLLTWAFELTPDGIKKDAAARSTASTRPRGQRLNLLIVVSLGLAVAILAVGKLVRPSPHSNSEARADASTPAQASHASPSAAETDKSVAVLPFVNMSGKAENEYFSDGLTETLLHMLAQLPELKVAARTSAFAFKGKDIDVRQIAKELGVSTVLEGSVQRSGDRVRITAQLIEAESGFHMWSGNYDRGLNDIFAVQDEIAIEVAHALKVTLLGDDTPSVVPITGVNTKDTAAYLNFLRGLEQKNIASYGSFQRAEGLFKDALAADPDFLEARLELAATYLGQAGTGLIPQAEADTRARPLLQHVLEHASDNGRARGLLAKLNLQANWRAPTGEAFEAALEELRQAISLSPNSSDLYLNLASTLTHAQRYEEADSWLSRGLEVDPLSAPLYWKQGHQLKAKGAYEEAAAAFAKTRELQPQWTSGYADAGDLARDQGQFTEALDWYLQSMALDPRDHELPVMIGQLLYDLGLSEDADRLLERAQAIAPEAPTVRALDLRRLLLRDEHAEVAARAHVMLTDDIEDRRGAYVMALRSYVSAMILLGRTGEVAPALEKLAPGISTPDYVSSDAKTLTMRYLLLLAQSRHKPDQKSGRQLDELAAQADKLAPKWREDQWGLATIALARGEREKAIAFALEDLESGLSDVVDWRLRYLHLAYLRDLRTEPTIAKRLEELAAESDRVRPDLSRQLADSDSPL